MRVIASAAIALSLLLTGCSTTSSDEKPSLTIAAAASLEASFTQLLAEFAAEHPDVDVRPLILDGSSTLVLQLREGAPFDVLATANEATLNDVADLVDDPQLFASNTLELAVAPGNPLGIRSLADLEGMRFVVCAPEVPCGAAARALLEARGIDTVPVSEEQNVTAVLTKVRNNEADAGLVYTTDVAAAGGDVLGIDVSAGDVVVNRYPIGVVAASANRDIAAAFVDFVRSARGAAILAEFGFGLP